MKRLLKIVIGVVVVLVALLAGLAIFAGHFVKGAVNTVGPKALGVPVSLKHVSVNLLSGDFGLDELVIGNPEGFNTPDAIRLHKMIVEVNMASLFSRVLVIDRIYVGAPEITYEVGLKGSNLGAIEDKTTPAEPAAAAEPEPEQQQTAETKKIRINDFLIENGKINVSTIGMAGNAVPVPLPSIHLTDIGKESDGATLAEVLNKIFGSIGSAVSGAVAGIGKGAAAIGQGAVSGGKAAGAGAVDAGKAVGAGAVDAGQAVGESAAEAGKAVGEGATKALEGVGNLFK